MPGRQPLSPPPVAPFQVPAEAIDFIHGGVSVIMGATAPDGRACAGWGLGARVLEDGRVRIMYPAEGNDVFTRSAQAGGAIAATFSAPLTYRSLQLKAATSRVEDFDALDRSVLDQQLDVFAQILDKLHYPHRFVEEFCRNRALAVRVLSFQPEAAYEQTPGPGAGRDL